MRADKTPYRVLRCRSALVALVGLALLAGACSTPPYPPEGRSVAAAPQGARSAAPASYAAPANQSQGATDNMAPSPASGNMAPSPASSDAIPTLNTKKERWWPEWSDPANWFLQEQYQL